MGVENDIVFDDMIRQLDWYGHVNRMTDEGLPKKMLDWVFLPGGDEVDAQ